MPGVSREQMVQESVKTWVKDQLFNRRSFSHDDVVVLDSFPTEAPEQPLTKTYVAMGFHFDEGGVQAELGSDLKTRNYVIETIVFGTSETWASNVAGAVRDGIDADMNGTLPLLDIEDPTRPEIDRMIVHETHSRKEPVPEPEPWQEFVWSVTATVQDEYFATLV